MVTEEFVHEFVQIIDTAKNKHLLHRTERQIRYDKTRKFADDPFSSYFLCCGLALNGLAWGNVSSGCGQRSCPECCETAAPWADIGGDPSLIQTPEN